MCGIVGYVGGQDSIPIIMDGLKKLEYRGYDSAGVAAFFSGAINVRRSVGKLINLDRSLASAPVKGSLGIGHTRWATHGAPNEQNAHPHTAGDIAVVHNGIIENYMALRRELSADGYAFASDTDTEAIPHLIHKYMEGGQCAESAFKSALGRLDGSYAVAVICGRDSGKLYAARKASPLVIGVGEGENFVASDIPALLAYTKKFIFLEDGDVAAISPDGINICDGKGNAVERPVQTVNWSPAMAEKGGFKHFMLKEIFEQPRAIADTLTGKLHPLEGRVELEGERADEIAASVKALHIVACGTSYHAGLCGKYWIEKLARIPVTVDLASEYRYRSPIIEKGTALLLISQSGETADTLAALEEGRRNNAPILAICNVVGSSIARASDATLFTHAGPEIGVASTKAFTTQLTTLYVMALFLARAKGFLSLEEIAGKMETLRHVPSAVEQALEFEPEYKMAAQAIKDARSSLFLGRGLLFPIALEGALKLKEISYIHAEGYAAGEMKHGPIALVDRELPVISLLPAGSGYEKMLSNVEEVRARGARVFSIAQKDDPTAAQKSEMVLPVPSFDEELMPIVASIPLQLLAYHVAELKGTDVDQPRNLAKSVTVE